MNRNAIVICLAATFTACASSSDTSNNDCAPAGSYVESFARSANAGDCPTLPQPASKTLNVAAGARCGTLTVVVPPTTASNGCTESGAEVSTASASGIAGTLSVAADCTATGGTKCQANFDETYTKQ
jgi:hypothetical protein